MDRIWSDCDRALLSIENLLMTERDKEDLKMRVEDLRSMLKVACGEAFSISQAQIVMGIGVTIAQMLLLKVLMFGA